MPYFVFRVSPDRQLDRLGEYQGFQDAKRFARAQRAELAEQTDDASPADTVKICHAHSEAQARALLTAPREPRPLGEDA